jgi:hypothetical protein
MTQPKELYKELLALTQIHLLQHYPNKGAVATDLNTYTYFKQIALQQKLQNQQLPPVAAQTGLKPTVSPTTTHQLKPQAPQLTPIVPMSPGVLSTKAQERQTITQIAETKISQPMPYQTTTNIPENKHEASSKASSQDKAVTTKTGLFVLEPVTKVTPVEFNDIRQLIIERFPSQKILDQIPSDKEAKKNETARSKEMTVPEVLILSFTEIPKEVAFLQNIAKAIQDRLMKTVQIIIASKLEQEGSWSRILGSKTLRLIIACDHGLPTVPGLMQHYREAPRHAKYYAGKVPLCLMSDISLYLNEPQLKPPLWKTIQEMLRSSSKSSIG